MTEKPPNLSTRAPQRTYIKKTPIEKHIRKIWRALNEVHIQRQVCMGIPEAEARIRWYPGGRNEKGMKRK